MKISELIEVLKAAQDQVGDVPVAMPDEMEVLDLAVHKDAVIVSDYSPDGKIRRYYDPEGAFRDEDDDEDDDGV